MIIPPVYSDVAEVVKTLHKAMQRRLTLGENIQSATVSVVSPSTTNTEFTIRHALGKIPTQYIANVDVAAIVYDSRRSAWTAEEIYLKCNTATVSITVTVL